MRPREVVGSTRGLRAVSRDQQGALSAESPRINGKRHSCVLASCRGATGLPQFGDCTPPRSPPRAKPSLTVVIPGATLRHDNDMYI